MEEFVEIIVDHTSFYVPLLRLLKFPGSYFCVALKPHWNSSNSFNDDASHGNRIEHKLIVNGRNPALFRFIAVYLEFGYIPRDKHGECTLDQSILKSLRDEADYFLLTDLLKELEEIIDWKARECLPAEGLVWRSRDSYCYNLCRDAYNSNNNDDNLMYCEYLLMDSANGFNNICAFDDYSVLGRLSMGREELFDTTKGLTLEDRLLPYDSEYNICDRVKMKCALALSLELNKCVVKLIHLQKIEEDINVSIVDSTVIDDNDVLGYYYETSRFITPDPSDVTLFPAWCCLKGFECEITKNIEDNGIVVIFKFAIVSTETSQLTDKLYNIGNITSFNPRRSISESLHIAHNKLFDLMMTLLAAAEEHYDEQYDEQGGALGVFTAHKYFVSGLSVSNLEGCDKVLYEAAVSRGIPVSVVYVRVWCDGYERINIKELNSTKSTNLLKCHQHRDKVLFVSSSECHEAFCTDTSRLVEVPYKDRYIVNVVRSALIIGGKE